MLIKVLPDDPRFESGSCCGAAAVAFMLSSSVETRLIVGLAHRSPPLLIAFTSAMFRGMSGQQQTSGHSFGQHRGNGQCAGLMLGVCNYVLSVDSALSRGAKKSKC